MLKKIAMAVLALLAVLAVAIVAEGSQFVVRAFQVTAGNVVEKQLGFAVGMPATPLSTLKPAAASSPRSSALLRYSW